MQVSLLLAKAGRWSQNLDPGMLSLHNLVLASTKGFAHRIYMREGIYAELALLFEHAHPWRLRTWSSSPP